MGTAIVLISIIVSFLKNWPKGESKELLIEGNKNDRIFANVEKKEIEPRLGLKYWLYTLNLNEIEEKPTHNNGL